MGYKCSVCGSNDVDLPGGICEVCAIGQDPYATNSVDSAASSNKSRQIYSVPSSDDGASNTKRSNRKVLLNGGQPLNNQDPYGNDITSVNNASGVQVYSAGQVPQQVASNSTINNNSQANATTSSKNTPISSGICKNIVTDSPKKSILAKWFRALFTGIPFTLDDDITMFQVFPDYSGTALNALGNACDQVIVYGRVNNGVISENNDVEIYGRRDSKNNIIAKTIRNKASGTIITPSRTIGVGLVWTITILLLCLIVGVVSMLGVEGIIWVAVILLCLTNLPLVFKIVGVVFGGLFSILKRLFK